MLAIARDTSGTVPAMEADPMSETQPAVLERTLQETNLWLKALTDEHRFRDRHHAYSALRAVLHALRDRLTPDQAAHLGAQLPTLIRGVYYEGWHLAGTPAKDRDLQAFADHVAGELPPNFPRDAVGTTKAVFDLLARELDAGITAKTRQALPKALRALWPGEPEA